MHKKPKKISNQKNSTCNQSPILDEDNSGSMVNYTSPKNKRIGPSLSREMLNSCIYDNRNASSPSFYNNKMSVICTDKREKNLRKFLLPSNYSISNLRDGSTTDKRRPEAYYFESGKKTRTPFTNSVIPTLHNTPLNTRKTKIYEMNQSSRSRVLNKDLVQSFKPISSMKMAWGTVSKTQRNDRGHLKENVENQFSWISKRNQWVRQCNNYTLKGKATQAHL